MNWSRESGEIIEALLANAECHLKCDLKMVRSNSKGPLLKAL